MRKEKIKIHLISLKPEICSLVRKIFSNDDYYFTCWNTEMGEEIFYNDAGFNSDCLIIDSALQNELKQNLKFRFKNIPIIFLPSLYSEDSHENDEKYINEPFRLSELKHMIDEIFNAKDETQNQK